MQLLINTYFHKVLRRVLQYTNVLYLIGFVYKVKEVNGTLIIYNMYL
jgi:hypothetical protein